MPLKVCNSRGRRLSASDAGGNFAAGAAGVHEHQRLILRLQAASAHLCSIFASVCARCNSGGKCACLSAPCVHPPGWCAASTAGCWSAGGGGPPGDRRCVHLPRSAELRRHPCTATQTDLKNAGCPSAESVEETGGREGRHGSVRNRWSREPAGIQMERFLIYS